jgi:hypothetical protein
MPLQILDRAQHQMRIRKRRSWPQQLDHLWRVTELGEPRSEVSHLDRCQPERGTLTTALELCAVSALEK